MKLVIDPYAGVCPGVENAIRIAEKNTGNGSLVALGAMIHNPQELERLEKTGVRYMDQDVIESGKRLDFIRGKKVLIRSHGVRPALLDMLKPECDVLDATCGRVKRVQNVIREHAIQNYQIVVVGKKNHPEMRGLLGFAGQDGIGVSCKKDLDKLDLFRPTLIVAQTTASPELWHMVCGELQQREIELKIIDTRCKVIARHHSHIRSFAQEMDAVVVVGGKASSNTAVLFELVRSVNCHTQWIEQADEWVLPADNAIKTLGITGGASTPMWQLETVRDEIGRYVRQGR